MAALRSLLKGMVATCAGYSLARAAFPLLDDYYHGKHDPVRAILFNDKRTRLVRTFTFWRYAPAKYVGGLFPNLFGLQLARYVIHNTRYRLRRSRAPRELSPTLARLERDGCVVLPRLLQPSQARELAEFYRAHAGDAQRHFADFSELVVADNRGVRDGEDYRALLERLAAWTNYPDLAEAVTRRPLRIRPYIAFLCYDSRLGESAANQIDGQDTPHIDVFYPSFKIFIYLEDVPAENGPLTYFKGSHAFSARNALSEWVASLHYYWTGQHRLAPVDPTGFRLDRDLTRTPLTGEAGTGIIFNVQGIHCRGQFAKDVPRRRLVLSIDLRQVECLIQAYAA